MSAPVLPATRSSTWNGVSNFTEQPPTNSGGAVTAWTIVADPGSIPPAFWIGSDTGVLTNVGVAPPATNHSAQAPLTTTDAAGFSGVTTRNTAAGGGYNASCYAGGYDRAAGAYTVNHVIIVGSTKYIFPIASVSASYVAAVVAKLVSVDDLHRLYIDDVLTLSVTDGQLRTGTGTGKLEDGAGSSVGTVVSAVVGETLTYPEIPTWKKGISVEIDGTVGVDYVVERLFHDPLLDSRCTIYVKSAATIRPFRNEHNIWQHGSTAFTVVGDAANGTVTRMKIDQEQSRHLDWSGAPGDVYPAAPASFTFATLLYPDGTTPVLGAVGDNGEDPADCLGVGAAFWWYGVQDALGDQWHTATFGDDDTACSDPAAATDDKRSDGCCYTFVVDAGTPCLTFVKGAASAQWTTDQPKAYFVPKVNVAQTTYLSGDVDVYVRALDAAACEYSLRVVGSMTNSWSSVSGPLNTVTLGLAADTKYELRYRIGAGGTIKTRILYFNPAQPATTLGETPPNILVSGSSEWTDIKARIADAARAATYGAMWARTLGEDDVNHLGFNYRNKRRVFMDGMRRFFEDFFALILPIKLDGVGAHPEQERLVRLYILDNALNIDPVGVEGDLASAQPSKEWCYAGYYGFHGPWCVALAYGLLSPIFTSAASPYGLTPVEWFKVREMLGGFGLYDAIRDTVPVAGGINAGGFSQAMWPTAYKVGRLAAAAVMPEYHSPVFGTSGAPGGSQPTPALFTPFPGQQLSWWDAAGKKTVSNPGTPNLYCKPGFWGVMSDTTPPTWLPQPGYLGPGTMSQPLIFLMHFLHNYASTHLAHLDAAWLLLADLDGVGLQSISGPSNGDPGHGWGVTCRLNNSKFPDITALTEVVLADPGNDQSTAITVAVSAVAAGSKYVRASGSFIVDGVTVGAACFAYGFSNFGNNEGGHVVSRTALEVVVDWTVVDEAAGAGKGFGFGGVPEYTVPQSMTDQCPYSLVFFKDGAGGT